MIMNQLPVMKHYKLVNHDGHIYNVGMMHVTNQPRVPWQQLLMSQGYLRPSCWEFYLKAADVLSDAIDVQHTWWFQTNFLFIYYTCQIIHLANQTKIEPEKHIFPGRWFAFFGYIHCSEFHSLLAQPGQSLPQIEFHRSAPAHGSILLQMVDFSKVPQRIGAQYGAMVASNQPMLGVAWYGMVHRWECCPPVGIGITQMT